MTLNLSKELDMGTRARALLQKLNAVYLSTELLSLSHKWHKPFKNRQVDFHPGPVTEHLFTQVPQL